MVIMFFIQKTGYYYRGWNIREIEYKGHTYIALNKGIAHAGHCKCNNKEYENTKNTVQDPD